MSNTHQPSQFDEQQEPTASGGRGIRPPKANNQRVRSIALAGNPNSGKSTLFNALTGLNQKVSNYPGVTVEKRVGRFRSLHGESLELIDLPGMYSLHSRSADEAVSRDVLIGTSSNAPRPDLVVCVVDATNLERNLYLAAQMAELGLPIVVALVMVDLAEQDGWIIDAGELSRRIGCPVIPTVAAQGKGLVELRQAVSKQLGGNPPYRVTMPEPIEDAVHQVHEWLVGAGMTRAGSGPAQAIHWVTGPSEHLETSPVTLRPLLLQLRSRLLESGLDPLSAAVHCRYAWVETLVEHAVRSQRGPNASLSERLDGVLTHRIWGWVAFLAVMATVFFMIFRVAELPMGWIESAQESLNGWIANIMPPGDLRDLLTDGIVSGVGGVVVFLPQILILFFFIGLLEDSGYLARAAFIMDRVMRRVGLHGKSFIPMLSASACAIPGIMGARTIENPKDRLVTILVAPLVSCSARLPVYSILIAVMLPASFSAWHKAGMMCGLYCAGVLAAFAMAWLFRKTLFRSEQSLLLMEMPPYRRPVLRVTLQRMADRASVFLRQAGSIILMVSILIWGLATYPKNPDPQASGADALAYSAAGRLGHVLEPAIAPLGYDWKIGIGLISSFAAREVFVGTMAVIYSIEDGEEDTPALRDAMLAEQRADGTPRYTPLVCLSLMAFYVLAMQCLSTVAVVRRETNSWRWPLFQLAYMSLLAWGAAFAIYQGGLLLGFQ
ncbi:MAG: ferrous iron transport protein B [Limisphaerales bacterium]